MVSNHSWPFFSQKAKTDFIILYVIKILFLLYIQTDFQNYRKTNHVESVEVYLDTSKKTPSSKCRERW